ncbi:hypothetical protein SK128_005387 [Halocaridina rubra]|uniref:Uncharacterized protein n=1 Tax=Halocaridina rubra TaxID=373956 RepID=A0AAN9AB84_HALRR
MQHPYICRSVSHTGSDGLCSCVPSHQEFFSKAWQARTVNCDCRAAARTEQVKHQFYSYARHLAKLIVSQHVRIQAPTSHRCDRVRVVMGCGRFRE